jgi:hypothetical protein
MMSGPVTLAALATEGKLVWFYCQACGHEREVPALSLGLPPTMPVADVGKRLVCSRCGGRAISSAPEFYPGGVLAQRALFAKPRT